MRNILLVARREYLEQIRGRAFRLSTIGLPLLFAALLSAGFLTNRSASAGKHVVIAAASAPLANDIRSQLLDEKDANFTLDVIAPATSDDRATLQRKVQTKALDGFLWIDNAADGSMAATYISRSTSDFLTTRRLREALNHSLLSQRLVARGLKPDVAESLLKSVSIDTLQVRLDGRVGKGSSDGSLYKGMTMAFLLTMTTLLYGLDMARSILEEKTSRIFEVMLAVAKPDEILSGKLIGIGAVGLTQIGIWLVAGTFLAGSALAGLLLSGNLSLHFTWVEAVVFPLYFLLGFFLYSSMFSGLAATCETAQELQMYMPLAAVPVWLSFGIFPMLLNDPNSVWGLAASFFPLTAPFVMMLRMGLQTPPAWQFAVSIGIMMFSVWGVMWLSSRLYRVGILMYGKRATLPELIRWLRYS